MSESIYLGIRGQVVCLEKATGRERWRTELRNSQLTTVVLDGELVIAYTRGHIYGLAKDTGRVLWENTLAGLGYGYCMIATEGTNPAYAAASIASQQAAAAASIAATSAAASS